MNNIAIITAPITSEISDGTISIIPARTKSALVIIDISLFRKPSSPADTPNIPTKDVIVICTTWSGVVSIIKSAGE